MRRLKQDNRGLTLIELLVVIAVIGCMAGLLIPAVTQLCGKADMLKCASNLRQVGASLVLYANEHGQRTPVIEPWPAKPIYPASDRAQTIMQALGPYGVTTALLQCPADIKGPNYYAQEGSSYQWYPMPNGDRTQSLKAVSMNNQNESMTMSQLVLAFDYTAVHNGGSNVLYGDGHVARSMESHGLYFCIFLVMRPPAKRKKGSEN